MRERRDCSGGSWLGERDETVRPERLKPSEVSFLAPFAAFTVLDVSTDG